MDLEVAPEHMAPLEWLFGELHEAITGACNE